MRGPNYSGMAGASQEALYASIDLELSWSEAELPQAQRTKHVHGLHPYLGKFVPQLVEVFLRRYFPPGDRVYDPFAGCGTTLVEANVFGADAVGCDISAFNCLLARVKTARYSLGELELGLRGALEEARRSRRSTRGCDRVAPALVRAAGSRRAARLPRSAFRLAPPYDDVGAHRPLARRTLGAADDAFRPRLPATTGRPSRTTAASTSASAVRSRRRGSSSPATRTDTVRAAARFAAVRSDARRSSVAARRRADGAARPRDRRDHLAAVPGPDRLPRAAPLRVRAARASRPRGRSRSARPPAAGADAALDRYVDGDERGVRQHVVAAHERQPGA